MTDALQVTNLKKSYGSLSVLNGVEFSVHKGEIFALLGVNGAGKTTALECIEGLRPYDDGEISINGKIGIQLQSATLQSYIKPLEAVNLFAKWNKQIPNKAMLEALGIYELAKKKYADLSTGQKRRLHLALALISDPDIVFLDEPTAGLDVEGRFSLHNYIRTLKTQGKTIVLTSHDMAEVESLCDRIAILKDGQIAFVGSVEEFTTIAGARHTISITTDSGQYSFDTDDIAGSLIDKLAEYKDKGMTVLDIKTDRGTLEEHFMNITRGNE